MLRCPGASFVVVVTLLCVSCGGSGSSTPVSTPTTPTPTVTSITVIGPSGSAMPGDSAQFTATAVLSNSASQTVTNQATWQSSNTAVATVSSTGLATAVSAGGADIKASYQGVSATAHIAVDSPRPPPPLMSTFSICGTLREDSGDAVVASATVNVKDTNNTTTSDGSGHYCLVGLNKGQIYLRATKSGYSIAEQQVNVTGDMTIDISMHNQSPAIPPPATPSPATPPPANGTCAASTIPSYASCINNGVPPVSAVCADGAYSCSRNRSGTCSSHGGVKCWVCPGPLCNGLTISSEESFSPAYGGYSPVISAGSR